MLHNNNNFYVDLFAKNKHFISVTSDYYFPVDHDDHKDQWSIRTLSNDTHTHTHTYICKKLTCYIKNIRDITMDNKLTTVPDDAATRETNPKKIKCLISPLWVPL